MFSAQHKHKDSKDFNAAEIFNWFEKKGNGTYGTLYIYDDEDSNDDEDDHKVACDSKTKSYCP